MPAEELKAAPFVVIQKPIQVRTLHEWLQLAVPV